MVRSTIAALGYVCAGEGNIAEMVSHANIGKYTHKYGFNHEAS